MVLTFNQRRAGRLMLTILGSVLLVSSMLTPWWTRGITIDFNDENPRSLGEVAIEGGYAHYGPFSTPGSIIGMSTDGHREAATAILGVSMLLVVGIVAAMHVLRFLASTGRIDLDPSVPVRMATTATVAGIFAVLWTALFLPLLGPNPGWLYGTEVAAAQVAQASQYIEVSRFANVGWFLGIAGGVLYPAALWADAAMDRRAREDAPAAAPARAKATRSKASA